MSFFSAPFHAMLILMTITQTVEIPASRRLTIDVPREVPTGPVILTFTPAGAKPIAEVRQLLQKEMAVKGTSEVIAESGDGWEAYVRERYAEP